MSPKEIGFGSWYLLKKEYIIVVNDKDEREKIEGPTTVEVDDGNTRDDKYIFIKNGRRSFRLEVDPKVNFSSVVQKVSKRKR